MVAVGAESRPEEDIQAGRTVEGQRAEHKEDTAAEAAELVVEDKERWVGHSKETAEGEKQQEGCLEEVVESKQKEDWKRGKD